MRFDQAKKLHNGDEVTVKKTGKVVKVIAIEVFGGYECEPRINAVHISASDGYCGENALWHDEIS